MAYLKVACHHRKQSKSEFHSAPNVPSPIRNVSFYRKLNNGQLFLKLCVESFGYLLIYFGNLIESSGLKPDFFFCKLFIYLNNLYTLRGTQTHDPEIKSGTLFRMSQPSAPGRFFQHLKY